MLIIETYYNSYGFWSNYVIKIFIFTNFRNINWTIFVNYVIKIFIFYQFYTKMSLPNIVYKLIIVLWLYTLNLALLRPAQTSFANPTKMIIRVNV